MKKLLALSVALFMLGQSYATIWYSKTTGGTAQTLTNWFLNNNNTGGSPAVWTNGDIFIVQSVMSVTGGWTISGANAEIRINSGSLSVGAAVSTINFTVNAGTLTINNSITINGGAFTYNAGTITHTSSQFVIFTGTSTIGGTGTMNFSKLQFNAASSTTASSSFNVLGNTFTNNGTFLANAGTTVTFSFAGTATMGGASAVSTTFGNLTIGGTTTLSQGTLINNLNINGTFTNNGTFTHSSKIVVFGTGGSIAGANATTFYGLTINTTNATDIVTLVKSGATIANSGTLTITKGIFKLGSGTMNFASTLNASISVAGGTTGNFANAADGSGLNTDADGGTINFVPTGGTGALNVTGSAIFYNVSSTGDGNWILNLNSTGVRINGTLTITHNSFQCNTNSPAYGPNSALSVNNNGVQYSPGSGNRLEWLAIAPGTGTIGTTAGYPNNVTLMNMGLGTTDVCGFQPVGNWSIKGILSIGDGTTAGLVSLGSLTSFSCGGVTINDGSVLRTSNSNAFTVKGNWMQKGTTTVGVFCPVTNNSSSVIFEGGTSSNPDTIQIAAGTLLFGGTYNSNTYYSNIIINNGAYVRLLSPVTLQTSNTLTLTSGILETSLTNIISITNTSTSGITGTGSATNCITGPVNWTLLSSGTNSYVFPVAAGTSTITYLPFTLSSTNTTAGNVATVQAFAANCGGSGVSLSTTEYWSLSTSASMATTGSTVSVYRPTALGVYNLIASCATVGGVYSFIGGTVNATPPPYGISGSNNIGTASPWFFALALNPVITTGTVSGSPFCVGNTGVSVPFTYTPSSSFPAGTCTFTAQLSDAAGSFSSPTTLQSVVSTASSPQSISVTIPSVSSGSGYRIRVVSASPVVTGSDNGTNLTINTIPSQTITAAASVCANSTGNTASVPVSAGGSYAWTISGGSITSAANIQSITYSAGAGASVILNCVVTSSAGCASAGGQNQSVTINAVPSQTITAAASVCANSIGNSASVPVSASGTYAWTISGGSITSATNLQSITYTAGAGASVVLNCVVTSSAGCASTGGQNQSVTINAIPSQTITVSASVCANSTGNTASVPVSASGNYAWTISGGSITSATNIQSITYTAGASGTVTLNCVVTSSAGCASAGGQNQSVAISALPTPTFTAQAGASACANTNVTYTTQAAQSNYIWTVPGVLNTDYSITSGGVGTSSNTVTLQWLTSGSKTVTINYTTGSCTAASATSSTATTVTTAPTTTTSAASSVTTTTATLNGTVNANNVSTNNYFNWGTSNSPYSNTNVAATPATSTGSGNTGISLALSGLTPNTLYHFLASGNNGSCSTTGSDATFTTLPNPPTAGSLTGATSGGFTANWTAPAIPGTATYTYTVVASTSPTFASGNTTITSIASGTTTYTFTGLSQSTTYYFEVMAVNAQGNSTWSAAAGSITTSAYNTYYNTANNVDATTTTNWTTSPTGVGGTLLSAGSNNFTSGDKFVVRAGTTVYTNAVWTVSGANAELDNEGTFGPNYNMTLNGKFTNNGTFNHNGKTFTFGTGGIIAGTNPPTFCYLTINTTNSTDIVYLQVSGITIRYGSGGGILTLQKGVFNVGAGNLIYFDNNSATNGWVNNGGDLAVTGANGADGGKIILMNGSGANFNISGTGVTHFYDMAYGTAVGAGNRNVNQTTANTVVINGTLTMQDNQSKWATNSPAWGTNATLYVNNNGLGYTPGAGSRLEWMAMAPATIGTTAGYPNNVTILNIGTSVTNGCGFAPTGTWSINGTFSVGDGTTAGFATLESMTAFTCGGIKIDNGSTLKHNTETFTVKGNWTQQGTTTGIFTVVSGTTPVIFGGSGTSVSPQTINCTGSSTSVTSINSITINNGTYVKLNCPVTLPATGSLTLTSGIMETTATNILSITNTATTAVSGGASTSYINGPMNWTVANSSSNKYTFPMGKSTYYLPFDITPENSQAGNVLTVEAFNTNCGGSPDGTSITSISTTEYWKLSASAAFTGTGSQVSAATVSGNGTNNMLGESATVNGTYVGIGGSSGTVGGITGISGGTGISSKSTPWYILIAEGPLSIKIVSVNYLNCQGSGGSVTVAGSGGTKPYQYNINGGAYQSSGTFSSLAAGTYTLSVKDNTGTIKYASVDISALVVTKDTGTCSGSSIQLYANSNAALTYTWWPKSGLTDSTIYNPVASPTSTTTYNVKVTMLDSSSNLISNGGFESGNTGFSSNYNYDTYSATYGGYNSSTNPATNQNGTGVWNLGNSNHKGIYLITSYPDSLCVNLSTFTAHSGTRMFVSDGPYCSTNCAQSDTLALWSQTVSVAQNTDYIFSYWLRNAYTTTPYASITTKINGTAVTGTTSYPNPYSAGSSSWALVTYTWNSGSNTSAAISLYDGTSADVANDFAIDDISLYTTCSNTKQVTVTITPVPTLTSVSQSAPACAGSGALISLGGLTVSNTFTVSYKINGVAQTPVTGVVANGSGNATFTTTTLTTANNGQILQITGLKNTTGNGSCTQSFTSNVTLTVNQNGQWLGGTVDWNTASNWCGGIPVSSTDVLIPAGLTNYPLLSTGAIGTCNNITIQSGSGSPSVTVAGNTLQLYGSISNSGKFDLTAGTLELKNSTAAQSISGAYFYQNTIQNLKISNSSSASPRVNVTGSSTDTLKITGSISFGNVNNAVLDANDLITLVSSSSATARVADVTNAGANSGNSIINKVIVERYLPMDLTGNYVSRRWRLVAVPISSTNAPSINAAWQEGSTPFTITSSTSGSASANDVNPGYGTRITNGTTSANGYDAGTTANPSLYYWNGSTWLVPANTSNTITAQNAYMLFVRGNRSVAITNQYQTTSGGANIRIKGKLNIGTVTNTVPTGYYMFSNPYASAVNMQTVSYNGAGSTNTYYLWDPKLLGSKNVGGWVTFSYSGGNWGDSYDFVPHSGSGMSTYPNNGVIESGMAFMLNNTTGGSVNISFSETSKAAGSTTKGIASRPMNGGQVFSGNYATFYTNLFFRDASDSVYLADGVMTGYGNGLTNDLDEMDVSKAQLFQTKEKIGQLRKDSLLAIERRQTILLRDTIFLQLIKLDYNYKYMLEFNGNNFAPDLSAFLIDKYQAIAYPISTQGITRHNFETNSSAASLATDRFMVVFRLAGGGPLPVKFTDVSAWQMTGTVANHVKWIVEGEINTKEYLVEKSTDGIHFTQAGFVDANGSSVYNWIDSNVNASVNYYRISLISADGVKQFSKVVSVRTGKLSPSVSVYPNPVENGRIQLQLNNVPDGVYKVKLLNNIGQLVTNKQINHIAGADIEIIEIGKLVAKGEYTLEIEGLGNYKITVL